MLIPNTEPAYTKASLMYHNTPLAIVEVIKNDQKAKTIAIATIAIAVEY